VGKYFLYVTCWTEEKVVVQWKLIFSNAICQDILIAIGFF
jgi:hypothetical protein